MHGFEWHGKGEFDLVNRNADLAVSINYNGDYSGDAIVTVVHNSHSAGYPYKEIRIPCEALLEFAGQYVLNNKISDLENMDGKELLDSL